MQQLLHVDKYKINVNYYVSDTEFWYMNHKRTVDYEYHAIYKSCTN